MWILLYGCQEKAALRFTLYDKVVSSNLARCLSFCSFYFDHYIVCTSSIYDFDLSLWYLNTFLNIDKGSS